MPAYRLKVTIEYTAKRDDSGDVSAAILRAIDDAPGVRAVYDVEDEEIETAPTQPDESEV